MDDRPVTRSVTTAVGWRVFAVDGDGALIPPFLRRYWAEHEQPRDVWQAGTNRARCLDDDHDAPDENCTCRFPRDARRVPGGCRGALGGAAERRRHPNGWFLRHPNGWFLPSGAHAATAAVWRATIGLK